MERGRAGDRRRPRAAAAPGCDRPADPPAPRPAAQPEAAPTGPEPEQIVIDPEIARRVAALEQRIGQVDTRRAPPSAMPTAPRASWSPSAARRALDRGVALGFLEALLRQRFGESQPQAVGMIITAAREPVTLQELQGGLQQLGPC